MKKTGETIIKCASGDRIILPFPGSTPMIREGDDLVLLYEDSKRLRLAGFYRVARNVRLILDGQEIDPVDFFAQIDAPALMPAEGEGHEESQGALTARGHIWDVMNALRGIGHLGGLDIGFSLAREGRDGENGAILINDSRSSAFSSLTSQSGSGAGDPAENPDIPTNPAVPAEPDMPASPGDSNDPEKPGAPDDPNEPDKPHEPSDPAKPDPGQAPDPEKPDPVHPDPPAPGGPDPPPFVKPWPDGQEPPVRIGIVDERNYANHFSNLEKIAMPTEEKNIPDTTDYGISTQADGEGTGGSRPTYETTNPNLPTRFGVSFELADGYHIIEVVEQGLHGHVEAEGEGDDQSWFYYLDEAIKHEEGQDRNLAVQGDTIVLLVGDAYGNEWEVEVPVSIRDDTPTIHDHIKTHELAQGQTVTDKIPFDFGADDAAGKSLTVTIDGTEHELSLTGETQIETENGILTFKADGSYSFTATSHKAQALPEKPEPSHEEKEIVPPAESSGGAAGFPLNIPDNLTVLNVLSPGKHGQVMQVGDQWVYFLNEGVDHSSEDTSDLVQLLIQDQKGNRSIVRVPVTIRDGVPELSDIEPVEAGAGAEITGAIDFTFGADDWGDQHIAVDGIRVSGLTPIEGMYGTLIMGSDGAWSYYADHEAAGTDTFVIRVTDADGSAVEKPLEITVSNASETDPEAGDGKVTENLTFTVTDADGDPVSTEIAFTVSQAKAPDAITAAQASEKAIGDASAITLPEGFHIAEVLQQGRAGHLEQNGDGAWVYVLDQAIDSGLIQGENLVQRGDFVIVLLEDKDGNTWNARIPVAILDDIPEIAMAPDATVTGGETVTSTGAFTFDFGADDRAGKSLAIQAEGGATVKVTDLSEPITVEGKYGTLTIDPDGTYSYEANGIAHDAELSPDVFNFTIIDADGDIVSADAEGNPYKLTITREHPEAPELSAEIGEHEAIIDGETATVTVPEGYHIISGGAGDHGSISEVDGAWVYGLDEALDHGGEDDGKNRLEPGDTVSVIVGDDKGNTWEVEVPVTVIDDVPVAEEQTGELDEGATDPVSGTVIGELTGGADGVDRVQWGREDATADVEAGTEIKGLYGTLTANPDGTWSYALDNSIDAVMQLKEGETLEDVFDFRVYDKDGDSSAQKLTITINGVDNGVTVTPGNPDPELPGDPDVPVDPDDPSTQGATELVFDKDLLGEDASALTKSGTMEIEAPDGVKSLAFGELEIPLDGTEKTIDTAEGTLTVSYAETDAKSGSLSYSFTLKMPGDHKAEGETETIIRDFAFTVTDTDGSEGKSTIRVKIGDDEPKAEDDAAEIAEGTKTVLTSEASVLENDYRGADGSEIGTEDNPVVWTAENHYGTFIGHADGTWTYELDNANADVIRLKEGETLEETITYKITDADGDESEATLIITITGTDSGVEIEPKDPDPEIPGDPDVPVDPEDPLTQGAKLVFKDHDLLGDDESLLTKSGTMEVRAPDGVAKIMVGETELALDGTESTITTPEGTLTLSYTADGEQQGVITYRFEFTTPGDHPVDDPVKDTLLTNDFRVIVTDTDGSEAKSTLHIDIEDDLPTLALGEDLAVLTGREVTATGKMEFSWGADNGDGKKLTLSIEGKDDPVEITDLTEPITIIGTLGTLTIETDGSYKYTANPAKANQTGGTEKFTFSIMDADGDVVDATDEGEPYVLTVTVTKPEPPEDVLPEVDEKLDNIPPLQVATAAADGVEIVLPEGYSIQKVTSQGKLGTVDQNEEGHWIYTPNDDLEGGLSDSFRLAVVREADGKVTRIKMSVEILDSSEASPILPDVLPEDLAIAVSEGDQLLEGKATVLDLPDGWDVTDVQGAQHGTVVQDNGHWVYKLDGALADSTERGALKSLDMKDTLTLTVEKGPESQVISLDVSITNDVIDTQTAEVTYDINRYYGGYLLDLHGVPVDLPGWRIDSIVSQGQCHRAKLVVKEDIDPDLELRYAIPDDGVWLYNPYGDVASWNLGGQTHYHGDPAELRQDADGNLYDSLTVRYISDETGESRDVTLWMNLGNVEFVQEDYDAWIESYSEWLEENNPPMVGPDPIPDPEPEQPGGDENGNDFGHGGDDLIYDQDNLSAPMAMSLMDTMLEEDEGSSLTSLLDPLADWQDSHGYGLSGQTVTGQLSAALHDGETLYVQNAAGEYEPITEETPISLENGTLILNPDGSWAFDASTAGTETLKLKVSDANGAEREFDFTLESLNPGSAGGGEGVDIPVDADAGVGMVADAYDDLAALAAQQQAENV